MNRIFHARVSAAHWLLLLLLAALTLWGLWYRLLVPGLAGLVLLLLWVERLIHTTYTLTDRGTLLIDRGRFARRLDLRLDEVRSLRRTCAVHVGRTSLLCCVQVEYGVGRKLTLWPVNEAEFIGAVEKRRNVTER